jgi:hypothetical protein
MHVNWFHDQPSTYTAVAIHCSTSKPHTLVGLEVNIQSGFSGPKICSFWDMSRDTSIFQQCLKM